MVLLKERETSLFLGKYLVDESGHLFVPIGHIPNYKGRGRFRPVDTGTDGKLVTPSIGDLNERAEKIAHRNKDAF